MKEVIDYLINDYGFSEEEAIKSIEGGEVVFYEDYSPEEYIEELINNKIFGEIPEYIKYYIDHETLFNDLKLGGSVVELDNGILELNF